MIFELITVINLILVVITGIFFFKKYEYLKYKEEEKPKKVYILKKRGRPSKKS